MLESINDQLQSADFLCTKHAVVISRGDRTFVRAVWDTVDNTNHVVVCTSRLTFVFFQKILSVQYNTSVFGKNLEYSLSLMLT